MLKHISPCLSVIRIVLSLDLGAVVSYQISTARLISEWERIPNGHGFNILHMEGIAGELKRARITQNEMKSGEGYSK